ncbi:cytochrome b5 reductase 4 isoform 5-T8 [Vipera latastei]
MSFPSFITRLFNLFTHCTTFRIWQHPSTTSHLVRCQLDDKKKKKEKKEKTDEVQVPLKSGRSLMDWIRLTKSGKDLTGLKGRLLEVTEEELMKHNKRDDCWICIRGLLLKKKDLDDCSKEIVPSYDWFQTQDSVTVVIYTKQKDMSSELVIADVQEHTLRGEIIVKDFSYLVHVELSYAVYKDMIVQISENVGKVEFVLKKKENLSWKKLGQPLENHNSFVKCTERGLYYRKCKLLSKTNVSHNTRLFCVELPPGTHLQVPVGHHLYLKQTITGTEIVKPYTPVLSCLVSPFKIPSSNDKAHIFFIIKIYPEGLFTPVLDTLQIGDYMSLSNPEGTFRTSQLEDVEDLLLLAGGTGFTPMVKLLSYALSNSPTLRAVKMMFFNKTEDDILWKSQMEQLALKDTRFDIEFVLSEPKKEWPGKQGKISLSLLSEFVKRSQHESKILICICGPLPFMEQGIQFLQTLGHSGNDVHCFTA